LGRALDGWARLARRSLALELLGIQAVALESAPDHAVAVGTALSLATPGRPPHRSQRAELPHWALASGGDAEALMGPGMNDAGCPFRVLSASVREPWAAVGPTMTVAAAQRTGTPGATSVHHDTPRQDPDSIAPGSNRSAPPIRSWHSRCDLRHSSRSPAKPTTS